MANTKLSVLPVATLTELVELYMGRNPSSERATIQDLRAFLLNEATREAVVAATIQNEVMATAFEDTDVLDGITLSTGDRILIKDQTAGEDNGIYTVNASGVPTRALDFDVAEEVFPGATVAILGGTINGNAWWMHTTTGAIVLDTTPLTFAQMTGASANFIALSDTPGAYTNNSGKLVRVNAAENAVEFIPEHFKEPVRVATDVAGTFTTAFANTQSVDGVSLVTGDRILIKDQALGEENGIYIVEVSGAPTRADDMDDDADVPQGMSVAVLQGTINKNSLWQLTTTGAITLDTTVLTFVILSDGALIFTDLSDTPNSYAGQALKNVTVNAGETALEFTVASNVNIGVPFQGAHVGLAADNTGFNAVDGGSGFQVIPFDAEEYDIGGWHDNSTNNSRLTVPNGVTKVVISASLWVTSITTGLWSQLVIRKNGSQEWIGNASQGSGVAAIIHLLNATTGSVSVIPGDYFEVFWVNQTDASVTIDAAKTSFSIQAIEAISPANKIKGPWLEIDRQNVSAVTEADLLFNPALYDEVELIFQHVTVSNDLYELAVRISEDDGATFKAGATDYEQAIHTVNSADSSTDTQGDANSTLISLISSGGNAGNEKIDGIIKLFGPGDTAHTKHFIIISVGEDVNSNLNRYQIGGMYKGTLNPVNGIRIFEVGGDTITGTFILRGRPKAGVDFVIAQSAATGQPFKGALVKPAADIIGANYTTITAVPLDAETYDSGGWHDNSTNNTRLTVPAGVTKVKVTFNLTLQNAVVDEHTLIVI